MVNVKTLLKVSSSLLLILALSGCFGIGVNDEEIPRTRLELNDPEPVNMRPIKWIIITPENQEEVFEKLSRSDTDLVLFGLTDDGYEALSKNLLDVRNYLIEQKFIILKYKEYYEPIEQPSDQKEE